MYYKNEETKWATDFTFNNNKDGVNAEWRGQTKRKKRL